MRHGMVKFFAHRAHTAHPVRLADGTTVRFYEPIPIFADGRTNRAILEHERRIRRAKTRRRRDDYSPSFNG